MGTSSETLEQQYEIVKKETTTSHVSQYGEEVRRYRIAANFGEVFNLVNWKFYGKSPTLESAIFYSDEI